MKVINLGRLTKIHPLETYTAPTNLLHPIGAPSSLLLALPPSFKLVLAAAAAR